ncbi:thiamine phosphate synthase [Metabacillus arenae]|uniref:Thiamine phosphate synthase n=1 Tax=Metabacillus arenae TaxID=2771434 RepID=A0A926RZ56_9BACI|nr:thiamine phosphate synthase [Metabacillus arenae]MBD1381887.1 thiamine phosphate synthase [Metabacillus arenae]
MEIHLITDSSKSNSELTSILKSVQEHIDYIHIREKTKTISKQQDLIQQLLNEGIPKQRLIVNDRVDLALMNGIHRVHLPSHSFKSSVVRERFPHLKIGTSIHSADEAEQIECTDYVLYGHIFPSQSKPGLKARGTKELQEVTAKSNVPVIAIGGIDCTTIQQLLPIPLKGIAVMSSILSAKDPLKAVLQLKDEIRRGFHEKFL